MNEYTLASAIRQAWPRVIAKAWLDPQYKARLITDAAKVLREEEAIAIPDGCRLTILQSTDKSTHLVLPRRPPELDARAVDAQLVSTASRPLYSCSGSDCQMSATDTWACNTHTSC